MHDGSIATLDAVLDHYAAGGRVISQGPLAGDGRKHPNKSQFVKGFTLSAGERADLLAFLNALTDESFLSDPRLGDPFAQASAAP
jgi:cytochrome c peroxidase